MPAWTADHRGMVGDLIAQEVTRQALSASAAASKADVSTKTLDRIRKGDPGVKPATVVAVARKLGLPPDAVQPPRDDQEQAQLDRVEGMLRELLELVRKDASPAAVAAAAAARIEAQRPQAPSVQRRTPEKGRAG